MVGLSWAPLSSCGRSPSPSGVLCHEDVHLVPTGQLLGSYWGEGGREGGGEREGREKEGEGGGRRGRVWKGEGERRQE